MIHVRMFLFPGSSVTGPVISILNSLVRDTTVLLLLVGTTSYIRAKIPIVSEDRGEVYIQYLFIADTFSRGLYNRLYIE